jgi:hypothetical protein
MAHTNDNKSHDLFSTISTLGLLFAIAATSVVGMLRMVEHLRPGVGDIISFDPMKVVARDSEPRIEVKPDSTLEMGSCILDVYRMRTSNGSLLIEATRPGKIFIYRVHWAGGPTSDAPTSCGNSANLLLSEVQITTLKMAASR